MNSYRSTLAGSLVLSALLVGAPNETAAAPGDLDPSFGSGGIVTTDVGSQGAGASDIALAPDGKLVITGTFFIGGEGYLGAIRYNLDGTPDLTFHSPKSDFQFPGTVLADVGAQDQANAVTVDGSNRVIVAGASNSDGRPFGFGLVRFNADGTEDTGFAGCPLYPTLPGACTDFGADEAAIQDVLVQPDGKILAGGFVRNGTERDFAFARYLDSGALDPLFGNGGTATVDLGLEFEGVLAMALQPDGKTVFISGSTHPGSFLVGRLDANGALDDTFVIDVGADSSNTDGVVIQPDGAIVVVGTAAQAGVSDLVVVRLLPNGDLDPSFAPGSGGVQVVNASSCPQVVGDGVGLDAAGRIIVAGTCFGDAPPAYLVARLNPDGPLDNSFGTAGITVTDVGNGEPDGGMVVQGDGAAVLAGYVGGGASDFGLVRYLGGDGEADADGDGIPDEKDVETFQAAIAEVPDDALKAPGHRQAMTSILEDVEAEVLAGDEAEAVVQLRNLRRKLDGCGTAPDRNDWVDCSEQSDLRGLLDSLSANLGD